jgi:hypothetical protein
MRFILVNGRTPCRQSFCERCREPIGAGYLRETGTRLSYCDPDCYADHRNDTGRSNGIAPVAATSRPGPGGPLPNTGLKLLRPNTEISASPRF